MSGVRVGMLDGDDGQVKEERVGRVPVSRVQASM